MDDTTNLNPPAVVKELAQAAATFGFTMSSDQLTGSLLRTLVASKPAGEILELGTGVGMGMAWLLAGMDPGAHLTTVDRNEETTAIARSFLGSDPRVRGGHVSVSGLGRARCRRPWRRSLSVAPHSGRR